MRNVRIDLCYEGTRYKGWQRLPGSDSTLQGKLESALSRILEEPIEVIGTNRSRSAQVVAPMQAPMQKCKL